MACLKANQNNAKACQDLAKTYLNCRMDRWASLLCYTYTSQTEVAVSGNAAELA